VTFYRRNLPHWFPDGRAIFLTWRLYASLPTALFERLRANEKISDSERFEAAEKILDRAGWGPLWLKDPRIAESVVERMQRGACELRQYDLHSYVVMANHVHALLTPWIEVDRLTKALKGATARFANGILNRTGKHFWQDESFDHWVRDDAQFLRIKNYIERNPVKAGLVAKPEDWRWSSAFRRASREAKVS
jgi:REP element-mobilizing transposase RayT